MFLYQIDSHLWIIVPFHYPYHLHTYCTGNHCLQSVVLQTVYWLRPKLLQSLSSFCSTSTQHRLHANCLVNLYQYHQNLRIVHRLCPERHVDNIVLTIRVLYAGMVHNFYMHIFWESNVIVCDLKFTLVPHNLESVSAKNFINDIHQPDYGSNCYCL